MTLPDHIFHGPSLDAVLRGSEQKMGEAAAAIPAERALDRIVDQLTTELIEKFHVAPLVLDCMPTSRLVNSARPPTCWTLPYPGRGSQSPNRNMGLH